MELHLHCTVIYSNKYILLQIYQAWRLSTEHEILTAHKNQNA